MTNEHHPDLQATDALPTDPAPTASIRTAGILRRFAAIIYDSLLLIALSIAYGAVALGVNIAIQGQPDFGHKVQWGHWGVVVFVGWMLVLMAFYCYFWRKSGQTLGMRAWRMQLMSNDGKAPSVQQCLVRIGVAVPSLLFAGLGYFWRWFDADKLTLPDRISNTLVLVLPKDKKKK